MLFAVIRRGRRRPPPSTTAFLKSASLVKQQSRSLGRPRCPAAGQAPSFAIALPEVAFRATKNPTKLVAKGGARWGPDCGPVAWRQVTIVPPEPHRGARLGLSRRGCSAEKAALDAAASAMIADMTTPSAIPASAGAVLGIDVNDAIIVESR